MPIAQPNFLMIFNEASGSNVRTVTNYGTVSGNYVLQDDPAAPAMAETTNFVWHPNTGPFKGYLESKTNSGLAMPWLATAATAPSATLETINCAVAFLIRSINLDSCRVVSAAQHAIDGGLFIMAETPAGSGDFDIVVRFAHDGSQAIEHTFAACSFNTVYQVAASIDVTSLSNVTVRAKLNSGSVQVHTDSWTSNSFEAGWPYLLRRYDFTNYFGLDGYLYYFAYSRGGTAWTSTDLDAINANPAGALTGWPSSGGNSLLRLSREGMSGGMGPAMSGGMRG